MTEIIKYADQFNFFFFSHISFVNLNTECNRLK